MMERVLKNRKTINVIAAILAAGATLLCSAVPAFASTYTQTFLANTFTLTFKVDSAIDYNIDSYADAGDIAVPLYMAISTTSSIGNQKYLNGIINVNGSILTQMPCKINGTLANFNYFEPITTDGIVMDRVDTYCYVILDDFKYIAQTASYSNYLVGYLHYSFTSGGSQIQVRYDTSTYQVTPASAYPVYATDYEYGFVEAMAYAISTAPSTQDALQWLTYIEQDTRYLPDIYDLLYDQYPLVLQALATIDQHVLQIYYQLAQMNAVQSSQAAEIAGEVEQKASQSAVLSNDMEVNKPQLSGDDINITGLIDTSVNNQFTGFLGALVQNNFITTMFLIALSCMIIGFVLYGKK